MTYDERLAEQMRQRLDGTADVREKRMFGGLAFLIGGNMVLIASGRGGMLVRLAPQRAAQLHDEPNVTAAIMGGRPMRGWLKVSGAAIASDAQVAEWVDLGADFARTLPAK